MLAADGGVGKTTLWCEIVAALSSGRPCLLDPPDIEREPQKVAFLSAEDSLSRVLVRKLRLSGAEMHNITAPDLSADANLLKRLKFGTAELAEFIRHFDPKLCVIDPIQAFLPPTLNMGSRNQMRDALASLISLGEQTGCTFLLIAHSNKRTGASARSRIADSADLWDIARSVMMAGFTEEDGVRFLSNEKNSYAPLQRTVLFSIDGEGLPSKVGETWKRDREFSAETTFNTSAPKREDCAAWIISTLQDAGGEMAARELEESALAESYSKATLRRAKDSLKTDGKIRYIQRGLRETKTWHIKLLAPGPFFPKDLECAYDGEIL